MIAGIRLFGAIVEEFGAELLALADVHRVDRVLELRFLEKHRHLVTVRRGPVIEIDHRVA